MPGSPTWAHAPLSTRLIYCCRASARGVLLVEKSPGSCSGHTGAHGASPIAALCARTPALRDAWPGSLQQPGEGTAESSGLGQVRSALHYCTKHLGTRRLVTALYNARKQPVLRAGAGGWWAGRRWGCGPAALAVPLGAQVWPGEGSGALLLPLSSGTSKMNGQGKQRLCCRNQYRSRSSLGAPPCAPPGACPRAQSP